MGNTSLSGFQGISLGSCTFGAMLLVTRFAICVTRDLMSDMIQGGKKEIGEAKDVLLA